MILVSRGGQRRPMRLEQRNWRDDRGERRFNLQALEVRALQSVIWPLSSLPSPECTSLFIHCSTPAQWPPATHRACSREQKSQKPLTRWSVCASSWGRQLKHKIPVCEENTVGWMYRVTGATVSGWQEGFFKILLSCPSKKSYTKKLSPPPG